MPRALSGHRRPPPRALWVAAVFGLGGCAVAVTAADAPFFVDEVEEEHARLVQLDSGQVRTVARSALPPGAQEGDVVLRGRVEKRRTEDLAARLTATRAQLRAAQEPDAARRDH